MITLLTKKIWFLDNDLFEMHQNHGLSISYLLFFFAMRIIHRPPQQMKTSPPEIPESETVLEKKGGPRTSSWI
jgi:hypothetical protein